MSDVGDLRRLEIDPRDCWTRLTREGARFHPTIYACSSIHCTNLDASI
jgi:hypothetical protein